MGTVSLAAIFIFLLSKMISSTNLSVGDKKKINTDNWPGNSFYNLVIDSSCLTNDQWPTNQHRNEITDQNMFFSDGVMMATKYYPIFHLSKNIDKLIRDYVFSQHTCYGN